MGGAAPAGAFQPAPEGLGLAAVTVAGVNITWFDVNEWDNVNGPNNQVAPAGQRPGQRQSYTLTSRASSRSGVPGDGGQVDKAVTDTGDDLLGQDFSHFYPNLRYRFENGQRQAGRVFTGFVNLAMPNEKARRSRNFRARSFSPCSGRARW